MVGTISREISWLDFNDRVLDQFYRKDMPTNECIKFIGIASSNLAEFISVRFSIMYNEDNKSEEFFNVRSRIKEQKKKIEKAYEETNLFDRFNSDVPNEFTSEYFMERIYPALTPISVGNTKELPIFDDTELCYFIELDKEGDKEYCFLQIPHQIPRVQSKKKQKCLIEKLISNNFNIIFGDKSVSSYLLFSMHKSFDESLEMKDGSNALETAIKLINNRKNNNIIFLNISKSNDDGDGELIKKLAKILKVPRDQIHVTDKPLILDKLIKSNGIEKPNESEVIENWVNKFKPKYPEFLDNRGSFFDQIDEGDVCLHYPYDSFVMSQFLQEAAKDPNVISIKQTLYRISGNKSPIVKALKKAAKNGIKVTVLIELFARFDERNNIKLIKGLKKAGCNIIYSPGGLKTHAKICLVTRVTKGSIKIYSQFGTGNYNEKTATGYTDLAIFTKRKQIGYQLNAIFNMVAGFNGNMQENMDIKYSPYNIRSELKAMIDQAVNNKEAKYKAVLLKMNSLCDPEMVKYIHEQASNNPDVKFMILCRGICTLPADLENLKVRSIVGRFLEHSRIYATVVDDTETVYISSADIMTRNLDHRVEVMVPIFDAKIRSKLLKMMFDYWKDTANSWELQGTEWQKIDSNTEYINCQNMFMK